MATYDRARRLQDCVDSFIQASLVLKGEFERNPFTIGIPLAVSSAFAAELAMKRLVEMTTGKGVHGHKLRDLWDQLDAASQGKVIPLVCAQIPLDPSRFTEYLDKCSSTFVDWRYLYEREHNFTNYLFLLYLAIEVRKLH